MAISRLYRHGINYPLRHTVETATDPNAPTEHDEHGVPLPDASTPQHRDFEVQLTVLDAGNATARTGVDAFEVDVEGQITRTAWDSLTFPEGVGPGSTFEVVFRGKPGILTIGAAPDDQHPLTVDIVGGEFRGRWKAS